MYRTIGYCIVAVGMIGLGKGLSGVPYNSRQQEEVRDSKDVRSVNYGCLHENILTIFGSLAITGAGLTITRRSSELRRRELGGLENIEPQ